MVPIHQHMLETGTSGNNKNMDIWQHYGCFHVRPHEVQYVNTCLSVPLTSPPVFHPSTGVWGSKMHVQWTCGHQIYGQLTPALTDVSFRYALLAEERIPQQQILISSWSLLHCLLTSVASLSVSTIQSTSVIKDVPSEPPGEWTVCVGQ
jgi:hypothetical protein